MPLTPITVLELLKTIALKRAEEKGFINDTPQPALTFNERSVRGE